MKFIKDNIKIIIFLIIFITIIILFVRFFNREVEYSIEYDYEGYQIKESYDKDNDIYSFIINKDDHTYDISIGHKYTRKRKIINNIESFDRDDYKCINIKIYDDNSNTICNKDDDYYDNLITQVNNGQLRMDVSFNVYNEDYDYMVWNGYGFTNKRDNTSYNFLTNESYSNDLAYQFKNYIIVADYDQKKYFSKFYIYDNNKKQIITWNTKANISLDSYFMGNIGDDLYLFDAESKVQYRLNIDKKKIKISSKGGNAVYYDNGKTTISINQLYYRKQLFKYDKLYNYFILNNKLYYNYHKSDKDIRVTDIDVKDIITYEGNNVYVISGTKLYKFDSSSGLYLLADCFEWNFDYLNKIYVFSR